MPALRKVAVFWNTLECQNSREGVAQPVLLVSNQRQLLGEPPLPSHWGTRNMPQPSVGDVRLTLQYLVLPWLRTDGHSSELPKRRLLFYAFKCAYI